MTFVDSNIPMYLVGAAHPRKPEAQILVERLIADQERLVTDAEALQEIVHRYSALERRAAIAPALQAMLDLVDEVFSVEASDVLRAAEIAGSPRKYSARDAIHLAIMQRYGVQTILSFDKDFDRWPGIRRLHRI